MRFAWFAIQSFVPWVLIAPTSTASPLPDPAIGVLELNCFAERVCVETRRTTEGYDLWVNYQGDSPITIAFQPMAKAPPERMPSLILVRLQEANREHLIAQEYDWTWKIWVHPDTQPRAHSDGIVYLLPYSVGGSFIVSQAALPRRPGERFYGYRHSKAEEDAIDFDMPPGTQVHAARRGRVLSIRESSISRKDGQENYVYIRHDDGTVGQYLHLLIGGALVEPGQSVKAGDLIGLSGNTGKSTGPHLHFHVSTPDSGGKRAFKTFPIKFRTQDGPEFLEEGRRYTRPE